MPLFKRLIRPLSLGFELLKVIEHTFLYKSSVIHESLPEIIHVGYKVILVKITQGMRERLEVVKRPQEEGGGEQLEALRILEETLRCTDSPSFSRLVAGISRSGSAMRCLVIGVDRRKSPF